MHLKAAGGRARTNGAAALDRATGHTHAVPLHRYLTPCAPALVAGAVAAACGDAHSLMVSQTGSL